MSQSQSTHPTIPRGAQTLARGLAILKHLVDQGTPITATAIAAQTGTHQSSASRLLKALIEAGYVRKVRGEGFAVDVGVFSLAASTARAFAPTEETQRKMRELSLESPELVITLGALWTDTLVHLYRVLANDIPIPLSVSAMPLHLSSHALLILLDMPEFEALETLESSRKRFGWDRPTQNVPDSAAGVLKAARERLEDGILILDAWQGPTRRSGAIRVKAPWGPAGLAYSGMKDAVSVPKLKKLLVGGAAAIEMTLNPGSAFLSRESDVI